MALIVLTGEETFDAYELRLLDDEDDLLERDDRRKEVRMFEKEDEID